MILLIAASWVARIIGVSHRCWLNIVLICISLMSKDVEHFSCTYWSFVLLFQFTCPFIDWITCSFGVWILKFFI
jgi:hypothetical protein